MTANIDKYTYRVLDTMLNASHGVTQVVTNTRPWMELGKYHRKTVSFLRMAWPSQLTQGAASHLYLHLAKSLPNLNAKDNLINYNANS